MLEKYKIKEQKDKELKGKKLKKTDGLKIFEENYIKENILRLIYFKEGLDSLQQQINNDETKKMEESDAVEIDRLTKRIKDNTDKIKEKKESYEYYLIFTHKEYFKREQERDRGRIVDRGGIVDRDERSRERSRERPRKRPRDRNKYDEKRADGGYGQKYFKYKMKYLELKEKLESLKI